MTMYAFVVGLLSLVMALGAAPASAQVTTANGGELYGKHCVACHQADGEGVPGLAPPLVSVLKRVAELESGRSYISQLLLSGMAGTIKTRGGAFTGVMPAQSALSDQELAAVASHVLAVFNDSPVALTAEGFAALRGKPMPPGDVRKLREQVLAHIGGQ